MKKRLSNKVERFLNTFGIEWSDQFGYIRESDGESAIPCSFNFITELEELMYKYKNKKLTIDSNYYWSEMQLLGFMNEVVGIFSKEYRYIENTSSCAKHNLR